LEIEDYRASFFSLCKLILIKNITPFKQKKKLTSERIEPLTRLPGRVKTQENESNKQENTNTNEATYGESTNIVKPFFYCE
jgi:hypothetical protein